jgi:ADP-ribosylglycohydrolase
MTLREVHSNPDEPTVETLPPPSVERFKGCILGGAIGDATGAPAEKEPSKVAAIYAARLREFDFSMSKLHHEGNAFGQYTDDTQLTRELALSILSKRGFDPEDFAKRIAEIFAENLVVGGGRATISAAKRLREGVPWDQAGAPPPLAGNGAAMRAAPVGLFYWNDLPSLLKAARDQAFTTHQSDVSVETAIAISTATAMCLNASRTTSNPSEPGWWAWLIRSTKPVCPSFTEDLSRLVAVLFGRGKRSAGSGEERDTVLRFAIEGDDRRWEGVSPWARSSVLWSLYCLSAHPFNFWEAVTLAIWPGGDVDTTAAMTGAMVGAHVGINGIPQQVRDFFSANLHDSCSPFWDWDSLELLATKLHEAATTKLFLVPDPA